MELFLFIFIAFFIIGALLLVYTVIAKSIRAGRILKSIAWDMLDPALREKIKNDPRAIKTIVEKAMRNESPWENQPVATAIKADTTSPSIVNKSLATHSLTSDSITKHVVQSGMSREIQEMMKFNRKKGE